MVLDDRGTGASGGKWESWGQRTQEDYKEVLDWIQAADLVRRRASPTTGESYMGITSLLIAEADAARVARRQAARGQGGLGRHPDGRRLPRRHLPGRLARRELHPAVARASSARSSALPPSSLSARPAGSGRNSTSNTCSTTPNSRAPGSSARRSGKKRPTTARSTGCAHRSCAPAKSRVPVVIQGGWWDLFQRGEPLLWESLKHSPDRVLFMSPHYHVTEWPADGRPEPQGRVVRPLAARASKTASRRRRR